MSKILAEFIAAAVCGKLQLCYLLDFLKSKTLWRVLLLFSKIVHQRVSPGKI